jgi:hypothetical protein
MQDLLCGQGPKELKVNKEIQEILQIQARKE